MLLKVSEVFIYFIYLFFIYSFWYIINLVYQDIILFNSAAKDIGITRYKKFQKNNNLKNKSI